MIGKEISIRNLSHSFGPTQVLSDINLVVKQRKVVALVGPSGCGKTTLLKLCAGLLEVIDGRISNPFVSPAFMFQQANLLPWKNTLDNIALGLKANGVARLERCKRSAQIGRRLALDSTDMKKFPHELSGGMQQRVALARAMVTKPDLLLLDEPFSALDIGLKLELYQLLLLHTRELEATVLMITHDLMEAVRLCDTVYLMQTNPGQLTEKFELERPASDRSDAWVYETTAHMMSHPAVVASFGLLRGSKTAIEAGDTL